MAGIVERIGSLSGTETAKAVNFAHATFAGAMAKHGHTGQAIIETIAAICRNHPNLVGIGAGLLVEQLLVEEKHRYQAHHGANAAAAAPLTPSAPVEGAPPSGSVDDAHPVPALAAPAHHAPVDHAHFPQLPHLQLAHLRPTKVAAEVFGALLLLKLGAAGSRLFHRKTHKEAWFAPVAHIHLLSGTLATYYFIKAVRASGISAWRNAAIALFATDAIKPVLKYHRTNAPAPAAASSLQLP